MEPKVELYTAICTAMDLPPAQITTDHVRR